MTTEVRRRALDRLQSRYGRQAYLDTMYQEGIEAKEAGIDLGPTMTKVVIADGDEEICAHVLSRTGARHPSVSVNQVHR